MSDQNLCPNCLEGTLDVFYRVERVPVHSVLLMPSREVAVGYPKGSIALGFCGACGFVSNTAFNPAVHEYSTAYEETQGFSPTFRAFHEALADRLIHEHDLHGKTVVEIGCGKGEFLTLLCERGSNRGIGFDPAFVPERSPAAGKGLPIEFVQDFYGEKYSHVKADFFCCKMTLEHIADTARFVRNVRRAVGDDPRTTVFFQVPDLMRVLHDFAFWDIYYEHCSYFSAGSLERVFREAGFEVLETATAYDDQYLMITCRPTTRAQAPSETERHAPAVVRQAMETFVRAYGDRLRHWTEEIGGLERAGRRAVVWGSGSKGVAFLTSLPVSEAIEYVVDINPYRQGKFMAGTGQQIVSPEFLQQYGPDVAIAMNPVYQNEIRDDLARLGLGRTSVVSV